MSDVRQFEIGRHAEPLVGFYCRLSGPAGHCASFDSSGHGMTELEALDDYLCHVCVHGCSNRFFSEFKAPPNQPIFFHVDPSLSSVNAEEDDGAIDGVEARVSVDEIALDILTHYLLPLEVKLIEAGVAHEPMQGYLNQAGLARQMALRIMGLDNDTIPLGVPTSMMG